MAISISYQPSAQLIGSAAYDSGLAEALRQRQLEDQARQQRDQALREQQYEFDATNQRQYDQFGEQQREFDVGTAQRSQQFAAGQAQQGKQFTEGQRQFDATLGLKQQDFAEQLKQDAFNRQLAEHRDKLARYGIMQQAANQAAAQQSQLAETDLRGQYGLAEAQMHEQGMAQREAMQGGQLWQQQAAKQMQADWMNIQKALPGLDPSERQDLIGQFYQRWQNSNVPMPMEIPQQKLPEWQDPDAQWQKALAKQSEDAAQGYNYHLVPDSKNGGMPSIMRGSAQFSQTPAGMDRQHAHKMEEEGLKNQEKQAAADAKAKESDAKIQERFDMSNLKAMDAEMTRAQSEDNHAQTIRHQEDLHFGVMQKNLADLQLKIASAKAKPPNVDANDKESPSVDTTEMEKTVADYKKQIDDFKAKRAALNANDPFTDMNAYSQSAGGPQSPSAAPPAGTQQPSAQKPVWETMPDYNSVPDSQTQIGAMYYYKPENVVTKIVGRNSNGNWNAEYFIPVTSREDIAAIPVTNPPKKFILPDGRTGTRQ